MKNFQLVMAGIGLAVLFAGCLNEATQNDPPSGTMGEVTVNNDADALSDRVTDKNESVEVDSVPAQVGSKRAASAKTLTMTLIAEIAAPVVKGQTLQSTSVYLSGGYAYVSYSLQGDSYGGAVDVIQIKSGSNAVLLSEIVFDSTDVHSLYYDGDLWLAQGRQGFEPSAALEKLQVSGGKFVLKTRTQTALSSFAATSVVTDGKKKVWATSGNTGYLYALDTDLKKEDSTALGDARWVDTDEDRVVVAQGTPGRLAVFGADNLLAPAAIRAGGAAISESKTTVRVIGDKVLMAAGDGGFMMFDLGSGKPIGSIPRIKVAGLDSMLTVTNAADGANDLIYTSNGEAGIYAIESSEDLEKSTGDAAVTLTVLGKLKFSGFNSANHVAFDGSTLVVATGLGGVKIVSVKFQ